MESMMKPSCLDRVRELYRDYSVEDIEEAFARYSRDCREQEIVDRGLREKEEVFPGKILEFKSCKKAT